MLLLNLYGEAQKQAGLIFTMPASVGRPDEKVQRLGIEVKMAKVKTRSSHENKCPRRGCDGTMEVRGTRFFKADRGLIAGWTITTKVCSKCGHREETEKVVKRNRARK